ncbi:hypothetical protein H206_00852 [Candidatus Electrothrix aarhusensis]|uniref:Deoxyguanosinetriphosphate triphosphohydrolase n=1 Tax=Candidatus Electrothrix aarhusensis TaxID=1859131 RepID=A0A444J053_9BACT|nr:hypothetical protein H206_00852 [Candidatus Electrothrix aarhusensis]
MGNVNLLMDNELSYDKKHLSSYEGIATTPARFFKKIILQPRSTVNIRRQQEEQEKIILSPYACLSTQSRGRFRQEPDDCDLRTVFQRDRDRILHSKTFRRLKHKTQVFLSPTGDHYRTRLTHVLEVSQIARTIATCLQLNEYLTELSPWAMILGIHLWPCRGIQSE